MAKQLIHIYIYISLNRFQNKSFALWEFSFFRQNIGCLCFFSISHTLPGVTSMPVSVVLPIESVRSMYIPYVVYVCGKKNARERAW